MPKSIWKFTIEPNDWTILVPEGAKLLTAREQGDSVCVWAEVDPEMPKVDREIAVYPTGAKMPSDPGTYIGTAFLHRGALVFHVYEPVPVLAGS